MAPGSLKTGGPRRGKREGKEDRMVSFISIIDDYKYTYNQWHEFTN
jgi:hypothetical protein